MTAGGTGSRQESEPELTQQFAEHLAEQARITPGDRIVVALSGGVDSLVLLHLLRFGLDLSPSELLAAHFDHRMRQGSGDEALWVRGLCRAWGVQVRLGSAQPSPASEEEAREARYGFLLETLRQDGGRWLLTAHQGDDQAETVLFRMLRGTGLRGLSGIPSVRPPGIYRPLLPFHRHEIQDYADAVGLRPRLDPSNLDLTNPRNLIRREILPRLEREAAPMARRSLIRLARLARENEDAWRSLLPLLAEGVLEEDRTGFFIVRSGFLAYHPAVQTRLFREALHRLGIRLDESGTRAVLEFTRTGASGRSLDLPGGYSLSREFDGLRVRLSEDSPEDRPLALENPNGGEGELVVGGRRLLVLWDREILERCDETLEMALRSLAFPLRLRGWMPGDRMSLPYGTKKLKKLMAEARIPLSERGRTPVLVDARGRVLWAGGLAESTLVQGRPGEPKFFLGIRDINEP